MEVVVVSRIDVRVLQDGDIDAAVRSTRAAGWNQDRDDWKLLHSLTRARCLVAEHLGQVAGTAVALRVSADVGWISMVLVDPRHRRQGVGSVLTRAAIEHLEPDVATIMLDATPVGAKLYRTLGFVEAGILSRTR